MTFTEAKGTLLLFIQWQWRMYNSLKINVKNNSDKNPWKDYKKTKNKQTTKL